MVVETTLIETGYRIVGRFELLNSAQPAIFAVIVLAVKGFAIGQTAATGQISGRRNPS